MVEPGDEQRLLREGVTAARDLDHLLGEDLKVAAELLPELVLPLLDEAPRRDHEASLDVATDHQLLAEEAGHDRLAGAGVVREEEPQRLPRDHFVVDGVDLVRQRVEVRRLDRQERVEQVGERDPFRLRHEPEQPAVTVHRPGTACLLDDQPGLVVPIEELVVGLPGGLVGVGERDGVRPVPPDIDDLDGAIGEHSAHECTLCQFLQAGQCHSPSISGPTRSLYGSRVTSTGGTEGQPGGLTRAMEAMPHETSHRPSGGVARPSGSETSRSRHLSQALWRVTPKAVAISAHGSPAARAARTAPSSASASRSRTNRTSFKAPTAASPLA